MSLLDPEPSPEATPPASVGARVWSSWEELERDALACVKCPLANGRTQVVFGVGDRDADLVFVGEGPGAEEDRQGIPFVGRAGQLLTRLIEGIGLTRDDVYICNVVKCRPPGNRDPEPDEIAACAPYLARQLEALDPSVVVTLGRYSMGRFMPGVRISQAHGTTRIADPETGARDATVFAMYHPAAALRTPGIERESYEDVALIPAVLTEARARRAEHRRVARAAAAGPGASGEAAAVAAAVTPGDVTSTTPNPFATTQTPDPNPADSASGPTPPDADPSADQLILF